MAIREVITLKLYTGQGRVLVARRFVDGSIDGYRDIGRVSKLALSIKSKQVNHFTSEHSCAGLDKVHEVGRVVGLEMDVVHVDVDNMAMFYKGSVSSIPAIVGVTRRFRVTKGLRYCLEHVNISNLVIKNSNGTVTYQPDVNYDPDYQVGSFVIMLHQPDTGNVISNDDWIEVQYDSVDQRSIQPFTSVNEEFAVRFEGMNTAEGDLPVVLECFRVAQSTVLSMAKLSSVASVTAVTGSLLRDGSRSEGDQFFREITV